MEDSFDRAAWERRCVFHVTCQIGEFTLGHPTVASEVRIHSESDDASGMSYEMLFGIRDFSVRFPVFGVHAQGPCKGRRHVTS